MKYKIEGTCLSKTNVELMTRYVSEFHVSYRWRYIWRAYLRKIGGLEKFKRAVAPNLRAEVVWVLRVAVYKNLKSYVEIMGHAPMVTEKQVAEVMRGDLKPCDLVGF